MNTSLHDLMNTIESVEFDAHMSVFSGFNSFLNALRQNEVVNQLQQAIANTPDDGKLIAGRLMTLLEVNYNQQYAHPHDVQVAVYLYVLSSSKEFPLLEAEKVSHTPNLTWAKRLAERLLANQTLPT